MTGPTQTNALNAQLQAIVDSVPPTGNLSILTDFDGTLSPYVANASEAFPVPGTVDCLVGLSRLPGIEVKVVTGRTVQDVSTLLSYAPLAVYGLHGNQHGRADSEKLIRDVPESMVTALHALRAEWADLVDGLNTREADRLTRGLEPYHTGRIEEPMKVHLEDKRAALVLHFRTAPHLEPEITAEARYRFDRLGIHDQFKFLPGNMIVEVKPRTGKETAVRDTLIDTPDTHLVCLGDDTTDLDLLRAGAAHLRSTNVIVGNTINCEGAFRVPSPVEAVAVLGGILRKRSLR